MLKCSWWFLQWLSKVWLQSAHWAQNVWKLWGAQWDWEAEWTFYIMLWEWASKEADSRADCRELSMENHLDAIEINVWPKVKHATKFQPVELAFNQILCLTFITGQSCDGTELSVWLNFCIHIWTENMTAIWINDRADTNTLPTTTTSLFADWWSIARGLNLSKLC